MVSTDVARPDSLPLRESRPRLAAYPLLKRLLDAGVAGGVLVAASPLWAYAVFRIKAEDGGPALYRGTRIGLHGRPFGMLKFRSMVLNAESMGSSSTASDDPRLTRSGVFLRRWKIDELPQLVNVLRGEMSLVGPRPQVADDVARYTAGERRLLDVKPGITDWSSILFRNEGEILAEHADVDRAYDELIRPRKIALGLRYVERRSLMTDLRILWLTARVIVRPSAAEDLVQREIPADDRTS